MRKTPNDPTILKETINWHEKTETLTAHQLIEQIHTSLEKMRNSAVNIIEVITDSCMPCVFSGNIRVF